MTYSTWAFHMAEPPTEFVTTRVVVAKFIGLAVAAEEAEPYWNVIIDVRGKNCPLEVTREAFIHCASLIGAGAYVVLKRFAVTSAWDVHGLFDEIEVVAEGEAVCASLGHDAGL